MNYKLIESNSIIYKLKIKSDKLNEALQID